MAYRDNDVQEKCNVAADPSWGAGQVGTQAPGGTYKHNDDYIVEQIFTYHSPTPFTQQKYETVREAAKYFAKVLLANVPAGGDRAAAIRKLREAVMTANAGIALSGLEL